MSARRARAACCSKRRLDRRRLGQVLLAERKLSEAELASVLKVQVSEVIFDTFAWKEGGFAFWDQVPPPPNVVHLEMDLQSLLMEGVRRLDMRSTTGRGVPRPGHGRGGAGATPSA